MAHCVDGFVFPVPRDRLGDYKRLAEAVAAIWKEHGALDYREYVGDDLNLEGTGSFTDLVAAKEDEAIVFGWVVFDSPRPDTQRDHPGRRDSTGPDSTDHRPLPARPFPRRPPDPLLPTRRDQQSCGRQRGRQSDQGRASPQRELKVVPVRGTPGLCAQ